MKKTKSLIYIILLILSYNTYSQTKKNSTAETYYKSAINSFEIGDLDNAIISINKSINTNPSNSNAHYIKGVIYQKKIDYKNALLSYKTAIKLNPTNSDAMTKCGIVYGKMNDMANCCKYFNMACENGNNDACTGFSRFCK